MINFDNVIVIISLIILLILLLKYLKSKENFQSRLEYDTQTKTYYNKYIINTNLNYIENNITNFELPNYDIKNKTKKYLNVLYHTPLTLDNKTYFPLGQCVHISNKPINNDTTTLQHIVNNNESLHLLTSSKIKPLKFDLIWTSGQMGEYMGEVFSIWRPIAPEGYVCLGDIIIKGVSEPENNIISCIPKDESNNISNNNGLLWKYELTPELKTYSSGEINSFREYLKEIKTELKKVNMNNYDEIENNDMLSYFEPELLKKINKTNISKMNNNDLIEIYLELIKNTDDDVMNKENNVNNINCFSVSSHNFFRCSNQTLEQINNIYDINKNMLSKNQNTLNNNNNNNNNTNSTLNVYLSAN